MSLKVCLVRDITQGARVSIGSGCSSFADLCQKAICCIYCVKDWKCFGGFEYDAGQV